MAKRIYTQNNYIVIDNDDSTPLMYFPKGSSVLLDDTNSYSLTSNLNGSGGGQFKDIPYTDIPNWYDETGIIPYSDATLVDLLTSETGFRLAGGTASQTLVTQENKDRTLGGVIDSTKVYVLDGVIDMGTTQITVPPTGITIHGYSFDVSGLTSSEDNYTMFISESIAIGSGNVLGVDYFVSVTGSNSKVYELYDSTGFNAFEFQRVNYNDCTSLGDIYDYRQGLEEGTGRFGGSPSLTLHGLWRGGYRITTSIVRNMSDTTTSPLFKEGTLFQMNSRFLCDINCDLGALQPFCDFRALNFPTPSTLQLKGMLLTRQGVLNPKDSNLTPNIDNTELSCDWRSNVGLRNTFVGAEVILSSEVVTVITTQNVAVPLLGTFTAADLQHFDSPSNGEVRHLGVAPVEYSVSWDFVLDGQQNSEYRLDLIKVSSGVETAVHSQIRNINNLQGGRDVAYFSGTHHENLEQNESTFWKVANLSGTQNCTLELDSTWDVDAR